MVDLLGSPRVAPFSFLLSFFAWLNAYGGQARTFCIHPFLFLCIFFAGLADSFVPTRLLYMLAPLWC